MELSSAIRSYHGVDQELTESCPGVVLELFSVIKSCHGVVREIL